MNNGLSESQLLKTARTTGVLYLFIIILAGFSQGVVRSEIIVPGDAMATAQNILDSVFLFRVGFVTDLTAFALDLVVSVLLYVLLKPVNKTVALITAMFRLLAHPAIAAVNLLNHYIALQLLSGEAYLSVFQSQQLNALVLLFLDMHTWGYLIAGVFFGAHLVLLGWLLLKSERFPAVLGVLVSIGGLGYLTESFGGFLAPEYKQFFTWVVMVTAIVGEFSLTFWLLIRGVKKKRVTG